jgi:hypothetical protein
MGWHYLAFISHILYLEHPHSIIGQQRGSSSESKNCKDSSENNESGNKTRGSKTGKNGSSSEPTDNSSKKDDKLKRSSEGSGNNSGNNGSSKEQADPEGDEEEMKDIPNKSQNGDSKSKRSVNSSLGMSKLGGYNNYPTKVTKILMKWLRDHLKFPYPTEEDRINL